MSFFSMLSQQPIKKITYIDDLDFKPSPSTVLPDKQDEDMPLYASREKVDVVNDILQSPWKWVEIPDTIAARVIERRGGWELSEVKTIDDEQSICEFFNDKLYICIFF